MLYSLDWLRQSKSFPPKGEEYRIQRYLANDALFNGEHFSNSVFRSRDGRYSGIELYDKCASRISRVVGNFEDIISFPVLLNYQYFMTLKMADLVCGEYPVISGTSRRENTLIRYISDYTDFYSKLYSLVIDVSKFGDGIVRLYKGNDGQYTFTIWTPTEWFPIVSQDGTNTILAHCICYLENKQPDPEKSEDWYLHVQVHGTGNGDIPGSTVDCSVGHYTHFVFHNGIYKSAIGQLMAAPDVVSTGLPVCAITNIRSFAVSSTVYGYDDYTPIDSVLSEIMVRIGQISRILDSHADPSMTGPVSMLSVNSTTGEMYLERGKFYATNAGETPPSYLVWDGQLDAAFKQLELLLNQLYTLSEMGAALVGGTDGSGTAISGTAMRFKMVNPLAKARRVSNSLTRPVRQILSTIGQLAGAIDPADLESYAPSTKKSETDDEPDNTTGLPFGHISVFWSDGLPDDPKENIENAKLATGRTKLMPGKEAIMEYFSRSDEEAERWLREIADEDAQQALVDNANKPGPQDGTGVNPQQNGNMGSKSFVSDTNKTDGAASGQKS